MGLLELLIVIVVVLYLAGLGGAFALGSALHVLLLVVAILVLVRVLQGQRL